MLHFFRTAIILSSLLVVSCSDKDKPEEKKDSALNIPAPSPATENSPEGPSFNFNADTRIEVKTFEVTDSAGKKSMGWGYDLFVDGKRMIHQPIIPAVPGNYGFANEAQAKSIGELAASKMKKLGTLPTISVDELDSLKTIRHSLADSIRQEMKSHSGTAH